MASVRNSKQRLRGQSPAGHELDLGPTRGCPGRGGRARGGAAGPGTPVAEASGGIHAPAASIRRWDPSTDRQDPSTGVPAISSGAWAAGERPIDHTLLCEGGLASPAPEKRAPTLTRY